jgi:hypothetical protein
MNILITKFFVLTFLSAFFSGMTVGLPIVALSGADLVVEAFFIVAAVAIMGIFIPAVLTGVICRAGDMNWDKKGPDFSNAISYVVVTMVISTLLTAGAIGLGWAMDPATMDPETVGEVGFGLFLIQVFSVMPAAALYRKLKQNLK